MSTKGYDVTIIGGGHAGCEAAFRLRQGGFTGSIGLLSAEPYMPYNRPPLSKTYLSGEATLDSLLLRSPAAFAKADIAWHPSTVVTAIDCAARSLSLAGGGGGSYGKLIIATGGRARVLALPGSELEGIHVVRAIADVDRLRGEFLPGKRLVIVGAGYIGLEVAAVAMKARLDVEIIEFAPRALARVAGPALSAFYEAAHGKAGVRFRFGVGVARFAGENGRVSSVCCADGAVVGADIVLVAAGLVPNVELAAAAGLVMGNGIVTDEFCRTSDPDILAIGDCAEFPLPFLDGGRVRLESVPNTQEGARVAASVLTGVPSAYAAIPWFWSDQYNLKLQSVGLSQGYDSVVRRPVRAPDGIALFYFKQGRVIAADCVNAMLEFGVARKMVAEKLVVSPDKLADGEVDIKTLHAG